MRFFTPELYSAFQSDDADCHDEWERRVAAYSDRLKEIDAVLPPTVVRFDRTCRLHDAELLPPDLTFAPDAKCLQLALHSQYDVPNFLCLIRYGLSGARPIVHSVRHTLPPFDRATGRTYWLYDEWDHVGSVTAPSGRDRLFSHSVLFSSGVELHIRFTHFDFVYSPVGDGFVRTGGF